MLENVRGAVWHIHSQLAWRRLTTMPIDNSLDFPPLVNEKNLGIKLRRVASPHKYSEKTFDKLQVAIVFLSSEVETLRETHRAKAMINLS
jgi:hypothetical protein